MFGWRYISALLSILWATSLLAAPEQFAYQGQIIKPDGQALEAINVTFTLQVYSPGVEECSMVD